MSDRFGVVYTTTATSITTQDITSPDLEGENGTWAVLMVVGATADGSTAEHARLSVGFMAADGTEACVGHKTRDDIHTQSHFSYGSGVNGIVIANTAAAAVSDGVANFDSAIAGGIRISWSVAPSAAYKMIVLLGSGSANAIVDTGTGSSASETVGFQPDFVVTRCLDGTVAGSPFAVNTDISPGLGFAVRMPTLSQASIYGEWTSGADPTDADAIVSDSNFTGTIQGGADNGIAITGFTSTGWTQDNVAGSADFAYLAVQFSDVRYYGIAIENLPSGTGPASFTGLGFRPKVALQVSNLMVTGDGLDTLTDGERAATYSVGAFSSTVQGSATASFQEGKDTDAGNRGDANCRANALPLSLLNHTAGVAAEASLSSMLDTGFQLNFSTATAGKMVVFAIGYPPTIGETVNIQEASQLIFSALHALEDVQIQEALFFASATEQAEQVSILEAFQFTGSLVSSEVVNILDGFELDTAEVSLVLDLERGRTVEGGALKGSTVEGGAERARTL